MSEQSSERDSHTVDRLVQAARGGDRLAVGELLEWHLPRLRAFVRLNVGEGLRAKESCSDLVQSTCREVLEHIDRLDEYRGEDAFRVWLFSWALNKIRDRQKFYRAEKRNPAKEVRPSALHDDASLADLYVTIDTPSRHAMRGELVAQVERAFDGLPEDHREVIALAKIAGAPHEEIARHMKRTPKAVRNLLNRALVKLSTELRKQQGQA